MKYGELAKKKRNYWLEVVLVEEPIHGFELYSRLIVKANSKPIYLFTSSMRVYCTYLWPCTLKFQRKIYFQFVFFLHAKPIINGLFTFSYFDLIDLFHKFIEWEKCFAIERERLKKCRLIGIIIFGPTVFTTWPILSPKYILYIIEKFFPQLRFFWFWGQRLLIRFIIRRQIFKCI